MANHVRRLTSRLKTGVDVRPAMQSHGFATLSAIPDAIDALFPRCQAYDLDWVVANQMGRTPTDPPHGEQRDLIEDQGANLGFVRMVARRRE